MLAFAAQNDPLSLQLMFHTDEQMQKLIKSTDEEVNKVLLRRIFTIQRSSSRSDKASSFLQGKLIS